MWEKVYVVEVVVEAEWIDDLFAEIPMLLARQQFAVKHAPLLHRFLK